MQFEIKTVVLRLDLAKKTERTGQAVEAEAERLNYGDSLLNYCDSLLNCHSKKGTVYFFPVGKTASETLVPERK